MIHRFPIRVYYEDTDMGGIVYHANYLKYIERARSDWVREMGMDQNAMRREGVIWVVRSVHSDFLATAHFDDNLEIVTKVLRTSRVKLTMLQEIFRQETLVFRAEVTAVLINTAGRPLALPANIRQGWSHMRQMRRNCWQFAPKWGR